MRMMMIVDDVLKKPAHPSSKGVVGYSINLGELFNAFRCIFTCDGNIFLLKKIPKKSA